jgi:Transposase DDE domain
LRDAKRRHEERRAQQARPIPRSRSKRPIEAKRRLEEDLEVERRANGAYEAYRARGIAADGSRRMAPGATKLYEPPDAPAGKVNLTDPDSRLVKAMRGWIQGYNAQAAVNELQIVLAAELTIDSPDFGHLEPMVDAIQAELERAGVPANPGVVLADAGYWHQKQMENVVGRGIQVLLPPDSKKREGARPGWQGGYYTFMRRVLATEHAGELYRKRQFMIEPVFGHTKFNRGFDRFRRRGRAAAAANGA